MFALLTEELAPFYSLGGAEEEVAFGTA